MGLLLVMQLDGLLLLDGLIVVIIYMRMVLMLHRRNKLSVYLQALFIKLNFQSVVAIVALCVFILIIRILIHLISHLQMGTIYFMLRLVEVTPVKAYVLLLKMLHHLQDILIMFLFKRL